MSRPFDLPKGGRGIAQSLLLIALLLSAWSAAGQSLRTVTVDLKNGTSLTGEMAVTVQKDYLTLMRKDQPLIHIPYRKVRHIYFGADPERMPVAPREYLKQRRQFFHLGEFSVLVGDNQNNPNTGIGVHTVNGYHFDPRLGVGLGVGIDRYGTVSTLPVYASLRGVLLKSKVSPYYFLNAGRSRGWGNNDLDGIVTHLSVKGGWMLHAGLGYQINFARSALLVHGGFKSQQADINYRQNWWGTRSEVAEKRTFRRLTIGIGLML